jgi:hypothetical protein
MGLCDTDSFPGSGDLGTGYIPAYVMGQKLTGFRLSSDSANGVSALKDGDLALLAALLVGTATWAVRRRRVAKA